jgi:hypothetical protein
MVGALSLRNQPLDIDEVEQAAQRGPPAQKPASPLQLAHELGCYAETAGGLNHS